MKMVDFLKKITTNIYVRNVLLMLILAVILIAITLFCLNKYTRHNESIEVPDLKGLQVQDAASIIASSSLRYEVVDSVYNQDGVPGAIVEQIPLGKSHVKEGRTIYLTVQAKSEQLVSMPDLEDASLRQAEALLKALGFSRINIEKVPSQYQDLVFGVAYRGVTVKAGQKIPKNSVLTLRVGDGGVSADSTEIDTTTTEIY
ncbi:PASTA domain-containing protein [Dysgonomonas capnocytophagoides]|uniref:PASTA domain-containing protein n=2 Tax=Dysgonomonas capnocytophagoides TaxID=45254 RepID=A0A4Y8KXL3_9BACT|nr:PASTA domain-containing protein [Dysgonomonas sp.]TFD94888.1 PASTA domain-containing protein [Dysgonomonas capnocytophagoides]